MDSIGAYLYGVLLEGIVVGALFWTITYITVESTSLAGAMRAALASEAAGNVTYLFGMTALDAPSLLMSVLGAALFVRLILRVGELTPLKAAYGIGMTYFALIALVACGIE